MATDPVCGMEVYEGTASGMMHYQGVTYYFCSNKCFGKFQDRPEAYVMEAAQHSRREQFTAVQPDIYTDLEA